MYYIHKGGTEIKSSGVQFPLAIQKQLILVTILTLTVLVVTIDPQWEGIGDVGSPRYEPALLPPCPTIRVLSYSN